MPAMQEAITLDEHGFHVVLTAHPVTRQDYKRYLKETGQVIPLRLTGIESPSNPITCVSQVDATAYCRWLCSRQGRACRLPTMGELQELAGESVEDGLGPDFWPHTHGQLPELRGGLKPVYLCEWTIETEIIEQPGGRLPRVLGSLFYPPWLREGPNSAHAEAHLLATEGYSFVTFRLAYDA